MEAQSEGSRATWNLRSKKDRETGDRAGVRVSNFIVQCRDWAGGLQVSGRKQVSKRKGRDVD
jgi:hypothetical protein